MNTNVAPRELSHVIELPETFNYSNHKGLPFELHTRARRQPRA